MLGLIHRAVAGLGPHHFKKHFRLVETAAKAGSHSRQLDDPRAMLKGHLVVRSALGLVAIYNRLPRRVVQHANVKAFQKDLQDLVKEAATQAFPHWQDLLSPRLPLKTHPLLKFV